MRWPSSTPWPRPAAPRPLGFTTRPSLSRPLEISKGPTRSFRARKGSGSPGRGIVAHAQILGQLDRGPEGAQIVEDAFGPEPDPEMADLRDRLKAGDPTPFTVVTSPTDGVAELHYTIAGAISGEAADGYTLLYARMVGFLRPDHLDGLLLTAEILEDLENYDLATQVYDTVPLDHPNFHEAELGPGPVASRRGPGSMRPSRS